MTSQFQNIDVLIDAIITISVLYDFGWYWGAFFVANMVFRKLRSRLHFGLEIKLFRPGPFIEP